MPKISNAECDEAKRELRRLLKPGQRVYTILRHVSTSGMFRVIDVAIPIREYRDVYPPKPPAEQSYPGQPDFSAKPKRVFVGLRIRSIGWLCAKAMGDNYDRDRSGLRVGGCGMDMGFHVVYSLGSLLWPKGTRRPHNTRNGEPDRAGGYALKQDWL